MMPIFAPTPLLAALLSAASPGALAVEDVAPHGRYVEARTASVFAGPCHYNAELTTAGREALLAWSFAGGRADGVDLAGARAVAAVVGEGNLAGEDARRESVLYLDAAASEEQRAALRELLEQRYDLVLGHVLAVRIAPIELAFEGDGFQLRVEGRAELTGRAMPDRACCSMPSSVWYRPLVEADELTRTSEVLVGYTERAAYEDRDPIAPGECPAAWTLRGAPRWVRSGANDAFVLGFRLESAAPTPLAPQ